MEEVEEFQEQKKGGHADEISQNTESINSYNISLTLDGLYDIYLLNKQERS